MSASNPVNTPASHRGTSIKAPIRPVRAKLRVAAVLAASALSMVALTPTHAVAASSCSPIAVSGDKFTRGNFYQSVAAYDCGVTGGTASVTASMFFTAGPGFQGSHIKACTMHVALVREGYGSLGDIPTDCTWNAQNLSTWELRVAGGWGITNRGNYHFTGWINIRTGVKPYNTEDQAVRVRFKTN